MSVWVSKKIAWYLNTGIKKLIAFYLCLSPSTKWAESEFHGTDWSQRDHN